VLPGCCAVTEWMARAADAANTNRLAIGDCCEGGSYLNDDDRETDCKFWDMQMPTVISQSPTTRCSFTH
jgi:hypothetical protein